MKKTVTKSVGKWIVTSHKNLY